MEKGWFLFFLIFFLPSSASSSEWIFSEFSLQEAVFHKPITNQETQSILARIDAQKQFLYSWKLPDGSKVTRQVNFYQNQNGQGELFFFLPMDEGKALWQKFQTSSHGPEVNPAPQKTMTKTPTQNHQPQTTSKKAPWWKNQTIFMSIVASSVAQVAFDKGIERYEDETNPDKKAMAKDFLKQSKSLRDFLVGLSVVSSRLVPSDVAG